MRTHHAASDIRSDQLGAILEAIEAVYAAGAGGGAWHAALDQVAATAGLPAESLTFFDFDDPALPIAISASLSAEAWAGEGRERAGANRSPRMDEEAPLADARRIEAIGAAPVWTARRRLTEPAMPGKIFEAMQAMLARAESRFGVLVLLPSRARCGLTTNQAHCLEAVLPHARRALRLNREVLMARAETVRLELARCPRPWSVWTHSSPPPAMAILLRSFEPTAALPPALSEIAELLAEGFSDKEIALRTDRPLSTVRTYVTRLYERTGLRSRAAITKWWWTESQLS